MHPSLLIDFLNSKEGITEINKPRPKSGGGLLIEMGTLSRYYSIETVLSFFI